MTTDALIILASFAIGVAFGGLLIGDYRAWAAASRAYYEGVKAGRVGATEWFIQDIAHRFHFNPKKQASEERPN